MLKQAERIQRIHELIKRKATGTPKELASRLGISER
jgi:DeoR/GlpR family transcriptional regulator of sugar metabolism